MGALRSASRVANCGAPLSSRSVRPAQQQLRRLSISFCLHRASVASSAAGGSLPSAAVRVPRAVPGVRTRYGDRGPAALTSATRSLAPGSDFGLRRRSVGLVLPSAAWWACGLTSRSSGRVQRRRPASPGRHGAAPLNSRSVRPARQTAFASAAFLSVCIQQSRLRHRWWLLCLRQRRECLALCPGVRTRTGDRRPPALTSATRSSALGSDFGAAAPLGRLGASLRSMCGLQV